MAEVERLRVFPLKGFDGIDVQETTILDGGTLAHDREFALFDTDGAVINGKRTDRVHDLETRFDTETTELSVETDDGENCRFHLNRSDERDRAAEWFSDVFDVSLTVRRDTSQGFVDRPELGPSVVSTATLETVASWFDGMSVASARRRLRANIEISGVPPFWEDKFVGTDAPSFSINGVQFDGVTPCGRCVVPQRDPDTGEQTESFRRRFVQKREETFPEWAVTEAFDHMYSVMTITTVPESDRGNRISVADRVV